MVQTQGEPFPGARYRVVRYIDISADEAANAQEAARAGYESMLTDDLVGQLPIVEVTDLETGQTVDIDLQDHVEELETPHDGE